MTDVLFECGYGRSFTVEPDDIINTILDRPSFASPSTYQAQSTSNVEGLTFQAFGYCLANESENRGGSSGSGTGN